MGSHACGFLALAEAVARTRDFHVCAGAPYLPFCFSCTADVQGELREEKGRVRRLDVRRYVCERRREKRSLQFWDGVESLVAMFS